MSIKLSNVTYTYGIGTPFEKTALYDTDVEIHEGEFVGIIGHTGSGKSTLVQILNGLIKPTSGTVTVDGTDIGKKTKEAMAVRHKVGMVFQYPEYQLFEETIAKDIAFGPRNFGLSEDEITERVKEAMDFVGLDYKTYADRSPFRLSGGQMRRVAIAGVIAIHPSYLILDEPAWILSAGGKSFRKSSAGIRKRALPSSWYRTTWTIFPAWPAASWSCPTAISSSTANRWTSLRLSSRPCTMPACPCRL